MTYAKLCTFMVSLCILVASNINCASVKVPYTGRSKGKKQRSYSYAKADQKGTKVIPKGTAIRVVMETNLSSETNKRNDALSARTAEAVIVGGTTLLPSGTQLRGRVESVTRFFRRTKMKLRFSEAVLQDGQSVQMNANEYDPKKKGGMDKLAKKGGDALGKMVVEKGLEAATDGALMPIFALKKMKKAHDTVTKEENEVYRKGQRIMIKLNEPLYLPR